MKRKVRTKNQTGISEAFEEVVSRPLARRSFLKGALVTAPLLLAGPSLLLPRKSRAAQNIDIGPSTGTEPYMIPSIPGIKTKSILTVGDEIDGYRLVGIPDGLGAFESRNRDFTLLVNHELGGTSGVVRDHGSIGAFVSRWTIDRKTLKVLKGEDHTQSPNDVYTWDPATSLYLQGTITWQRHCSADLPKEGAFFHDGRGTRERIYLNGEEFTAGQEQGAAWARIATGSHKGEAWQLPRFGRMSYENVVASPYPQDKTIVVLLDDANLSTAATATAFPSEVYIYIGRKRRQGHPIEQAGLTNGNLYGVKISVNGNPVTEESNEFGLGDSTTGFIGSGKFSLHNLGDVSNFTARQLEDASILAGVARLQRVEDGAWDPRRKHKNDFYFVTTASLTSNCRLWRLRFDDIEHPEKGGKIDILLRGGEGHGMLDNVTIDRRGRILMDEDPGNSGRIAKIWLYDISSGDFIEVAAHNPKFFDSTAPTPPTFITQDEESSGIIDAEHILGKGWFLFDVQVHDSNHLNPTLRTELVEGGQLLALHVDPSIGGDEDDDDDRD